jgi:hypothetical protein
MKDNKREMNINDLALDRGNLRVLIDKQMQYMSKAGRSTSWLQFQRLPAWREIQETATAETMAIYELVWRTRYKREVWKAWLANLVAENHLAKIDLSVIQNEMHLNYAAAWMCWAELHDDRPHVFALLAPDCRTFAMSKDHGAEIRRRLAMQPNWLWGQRVEGRPEMNTEPFAAILDPLGLVVSIRWARDVDVRDWQTLILEGNAEGFSIVSARDHQEIHTPPGRNLFTPGTLIGTGTKTVYQRGENGELVNVTKHPHKLRTDLPGFRRAGRN